MSLRIRRGDAEAPLDPLRGRTVAVIGYGNQGHAHALNLRDSGITVVVGARNESRSAVRAATAGFPVLGLTEAAAQADLVILAAPDEAHAEIYRLHLARAMAPGSVLGFLHGFSIHYGRVEPRADVGVVLVAPKGPGATLRSRFVAGLGIPCLFAVHQESPDHTAQAIALAWANGIGSARAGVIDASFKDETETDLFGEQAVLCGGLLTLIRAAFETLVAAGYSPELAYIECCHEVKQVADLVYEHGPAGMCARISNTAEFGAYHAARLLDTAELRAHCAQLLRDVQSGAFAADMLKDHANGWARFSAARTAWSAHDMERAGATVRAAALGRGDDQTRPV
jgi:ketol-acid reductoisomerase